MARTMGSFCSLLFLWLCALGAGPARQSVASLESARSVVELALRDVAEAPRLASSARATQVGSPRLAARHAPVPLTGRPARPVVLVARVGATARATLARQAKAHAFRPRWRAYDAAAPPVPAGFFAR